LGFLFRIGPMNLTSRQKTLTLYFSTLGVVAASGATFWGYWLSGVLFS